MKTLISILFLIAFTSLSAQEVNPVLYEKTWLDNETRYINGYAITKVFGQMPHAPSAYNVMPITSVAYNGLERLKEALTKEADSAKLSVAERDDKFTELEENAKGGEIEIYISRYDEEQANLRWFFVILRGIDDKGKLWEKELGYKAPEMPFERGWWNYTKLQIPIEIEPPFYIYLNDKSSKYLSDFKFKVESAPKQSKVE